MVAGQGRRHLWAARPLRCHWAGLWKAALADAPQWRGRPKAGHFGPAFRAGADRQLRQPIRDAHAWGCDLHGHAWHYAQDESWRHGGSRYRRDWGVAEQDRGGHVVLAEDARGLLPALVRSRLAAGLLSGLGELC